MVRERIRKEISEMEFETAYRYDGLKYSWGTDEFDNPLPGCDIRVILREYDIIKKTPKGFWINYCKDTGKNKFRFVLSNARKKFAHETIEAAAESFVARKERQIKILKAQLECAKKELCIFNHEINRSIG